MRNERHIAPCVADDPAVEAIMETIKAHCSRDPSEPLSLTNTIDGDLAIEKVLLTLASLLGGLPDGYRQQRVRDVRAFLPKGAEAAAALSMAQLGGNA